jgi:hypothetical protein
MPPLIFAPLTHPRRLSASGRALALGLALGCAAVLAVAVWVQPDPSGVSSHTQLGMRPCAWPQRLGIPCLTCGMTTSFSHFVRGQVAASFYVQPMGAILAVTVAMAFWGGLYVALTGRPAYRLLRCVPALYYVTWLVALTLGAWAWKIGIHLSGHDGWSY